MKPIVSRLCLWIAALAAAGLAPAPAASAQPLENPWKICAAQTAERERLEGIPRHLLGAISLAESGRWDAAGQANVAWPWTVTAHREGRFFATKRDAVTYVLELWSQGVTNIDVGCMQVNQYYHGGAFADIEQALDPAANVAYASRYLKNLYAVARSWTTAAGYYHSSTPARHNAYKLKVLRLWSQERRGGGGATSGDRKTVAIDTARTAELNARFKAARDGQRAATEGELPVLRQARLHRRQLDAWRQVRGNPRASANLAAVQLAVAAARRQQALLELSGSKDDAGFAAKRRSQLEAWRATLAPAPGSS